MSKKVTIIGIKSKKQLLVEDKEYQVTEEKAKILVDAKRAKLKK